MLAIDYKGFVLQPYSRGIKAVFKNKKRVLFDSFETAKQGIDELMVGVKIEYVLRPKRVVKHRVKKEKPMVKEVNNYRHIKI